MCSPGDPFHASPEVHKGAISSKSVSPKDPLLRKFRNFSLYSLNFCPTFSSQAPNLEIFSSQAPSLSEANISWQAPHFGNPGRTPLPEKSWVPTPPHPRSFGHPSVRAVISLSSNYCARKGVIKEHRTVFLLQSHC